MPSKRANLVAFIIDAEAVHLSGTRADAVHKMSEFMIENISQVLVRSWKTGRDIATSPTIESPESTINPHSAASASAEGDLFNLSVSRAILGGSRPGELVN